MHSFQIQCPAVGFFITFLAFDARAVKPSLGLNDVFAITAVENVAVKKALDFDDPSIFAIAVWI